LQRGPTGLLVAITERACYLDIRCYRAFPLSCPEQWIVFLDGAGHEIGVLRSIEELDPPSQLLCRQELQWRYVVPRALEIVAIRAESGEGTGSAQLVWDVQTDRGPMRLHIPNLYEAVRVLSGNRMLLTDRDGRRLLLQDVASLSARSRTLLARYLWLDTVQEGGR